MSCSATLEGIKLEEKPSAVGMDEYFERSKFPYKIIKAKSYHLISHCVCVALGKKSFI